MSDCKCGVCLENIMFRHIVTLNCCKQAVHLDCLLQSLHNSDLCIYCRAPMNVKKYLTKKTTIENVDATYDIGRITNISRIDTQVLVLDQHSPENRPHITISMVASIALSIILIGSIAKDIQLYSEYIGPVF
jgi:hypothetical protein